MCLISKTKIPKVATENIIVYKTVTLLSGYLCGYIRNYKYSKHEKSKFIIRQSEHTSYITSTYSYIISTGLHSNKNITSYSRSNNEYVSEWIIPKGSLYYEDIMDSTLVSNELIFKKLQGNVKYKLLNNFNLWKEIKKTICYMKTYIDQFIFL